MPLADAGWLTTGRMRLQDEAVRKRLIETWHWRSSLMRRLTDSICRIGDGDHGLNMKRRLRGLLDSLPATAAKPLPKKKKGRRSLTWVGTTLVMKVGGASDPSTGHLSSLSGKTMPDTPTAGSARRGPLPLSFDREGSLYKSHLGRRYASTCWSRRRRADCGRRGARSPGCGREALAAARGDHADEGDPRPGVRFRASVSIGHLDPCARSSR